MNRQVSLWLAFALALCLAGCATIPQTFDQAVAHANGQITGVAKSAAQLVTAGAISPERGKEISDDLKEASRTIDRAEAAYAIGDITTADGLLRAANAILLELAKEVNP